MKEELTREESLDLITQMIVQAKRNAAKGGSFYFLLWGWVVAIANLGHYLIDRYDWYKHPYIVWLVTIPAVIITIVYSARRERNAKVVGHYDRIYGQIWISIFIGIVILLIFMPKLNFNHNAVILLLSAVGTYTSGYILKFKPLILGGVALGISAVVAFSVTVNDQYLVAFIGLVLGYLVPGFLLKKAENEYV